MAIAGQIEYQITVDTSGLKKGLNQAKAESNKFATSVANGAKSAGKILATSFIAGATAATGAIAKLTKDSISLYADYEQLVGGVEKIFEDSADIIMNYAQEAYKTAGISANEYLEQATSFSAKLIKETGGDTKRVAELTDLAIKDMADNANTFGTSLESIQNAYAGLAKGNATMLDNLKIGYGGTSTEMLKLAKDMGVIDDSVKSFNDMKFEDAIEAIHKLQGELKITGTTAKEAQSTISGSLGMMKASWKNLLTGMADENADFNTLIKNFTDSAGAFGKNILPRIKTAIKGAVELIKTLIPEIVKILPDLIGELLPPLMEAVQSLLVALVENLPSLVQVLTDSVPSLITAILNIVQAIIDNLPTILDALTQLVIGIVNGLLAPENLKMMLKAGWTLGTQLILAIPDILVALIEALPDIIDGIVDFLTDPENLMIIIEGAVKLFMGIVQAVPKILGALFEAFGRLIGNLWNKLVDLFKAFAGNFGEAISNVFKGAVNGVLWFIEQFINGPIDIINLFIDAINGLLGAVSGGTAQIGKLGRISLPRLATGGIVPSQTGGKLILAGEGGQDEWVVPESKMASLVDKINEQSDSGRAITINIQGVFATSDAEQRAVAEQIYEKLQEINKSRMGAYL